MDGTIIGPGRSGLELWGGLECTIARVGDDVRDQVRDTGHAEREGDLALVAALGIRRLRYPVLWEQVSPDDPDACDWTWHDRRLAEMQRLGIAPIAGLMHHGSGPRYTSLVDPDLPGKLAVHARRVAERYPWIDHFTPVNEPMTTARFSGLYGHWYPHGQDMATFYATLVNQVRAVAAAMAAIREVSPGARLVQTEDMGKVFSTPGLAYQADYENTRRWLSFDLLCGRVDREHPLWPELTGAGIPQDHLESFLEAPCPPDIVGINHYLTSERYLDENREAYPAFSWGGNAFQTYADVEAVRVELPGVDTGPEERLRETWERYHLPVAVTEVHLGCTRDEQLRWLRQIWDCAERLRVDGVEMRAVTVWSLFGAVDWNSLLTRRSGFYEPGAFDIRSPDGTPRPTALARAAASLARDGTFDDPVLDGQAWWQRPDRFYGAGRARSYRRASPGSRSILVVGDGRLGRAVAAACRIRGLACTVAGRAALDPGDPVRLDAAIDAARAWAIVNCTGFPSSLSAEREPERAYRANVLDAVALAEACRRRGLRFVSLSSDQVFDGSEPAPYGESHPVQPLGLFGQTKAEGERLILAAHEGALVARTGPLFGSGPTDMVFRQLRQIVRVAGLERGEEAVVSPTYIPDLVHAMLDLLIDGSGGLWHLAPEDTMTSTELMERLGPGRTASRPSGREAINLALTSERAVLLPPLHGVWSRYQPARRAARGSRQAGAQAQAHSAG